MPGALPFVGPGLDVVGSIFGGKQQQQGEQQQSAASQAAAQAMSQLINKGILPGINSEMQTYQQDFAPLQQGMSGAYGGLIPGLNLAGNYQNMMGLGNQVIGGLGGLQGVTQNAFNGLQQLAPQIISSLGNLQGVSQNAYGALNQVAPQAMNLYEKTAQHGLSPAVIGNAYNQLQTQDRQQLNTLMDQFGAATPNPAGMLSDMQMNDAMARAQLGSNLAAQNQGLKLQGAGLATGLGQQLGQDTMSQVEQMAQLMNQQMGTSQQMGQDTMSQVAQMAQLMQQQMGTSEGIFDSGMNAAQQIGGYANQGESFLGNAMNSLMSLAGMYGNMASGAASNMSNMMNSGGGWGGAMSSIGNIISGLPGMGMPGSPSMIGNPNAGTPYNFPTNMAFPTLPANPWGMTGPQP